jgi:hypothetical protein
LRHADHETSSIHLAARRRQLQDVNSRVALRVRTAIAEGTAEAARILENTKRQADSILDDADREAMARREEAEAVYEGARTKAATAAVDFETTLAARRDASTVEFAAEATAADQQLATIGLQTEQARIETEQSQQEAASRFKQQLEQAMNQAHMLVAEAKSKAERIRGGSERGLAAATQRRDSINAQLSNVRQMLAALSGVAAGIRWSGRHLLLANGSRLLPALHPPTREGFHRRQGRQGRDRQAQGRQGEGRQGQRQEGRLEPGALRQGLSVRTRTRLADPCGISKPHCHFCCASDDRC